MNQRNAKLMGHVTATLIRTGADKPKQLAKQAYNHYANLKRKLKREWNLKPAPVRYTQRLGVIRALVAAAEGVQHAKA